MAGKRATLNRLLVKPYEENAKTASGKPPFFGGWGKGFFLA